MRPLLPLAALTVLAASEAPIPISRHVDPFIGTGSHGHTYPGPSRPFGRVQLGPDTRNDGSWDSCAGYHHSDPTILGFSHTHLSGVGVPDYGDILVMPMMGEGRLDPGDPSKPGSGYRSRFRKSSEQASAGYYAVELTDPDVRAELTTTERVGYHRYTFQKAGRASMLIDLIHRNPVTEGFLRVVSPTRLEGFRRAKYWAGDQRHYFALEFSRPVLGMRLFKDGRPWQGTGRLEGTALQALADLEVKAGESLEVKVSLSAVDEQGAWRNLETEGRGRRFDQVVAESRGVWERSLGRIQVEGGTEAQRRTFYTALYHCLLTPNLFQDVDGRYRGMDGRVHVAEGPRQHTVFSLWDTFRALHPLLTLLEPERTADFCATLTRMGQQYGEIPMWELAANDTRCMIGYHGVSVIADAWAKGIRGFDVEAAYAQMRRTALLDKRGLQDYRTFGFAPSNKTSQSVSKTLEYAYDDWCIAQVAKALGKLDDHRMFLARSQAYRSLFDPRHGFMRARMDDSTWVGETFDPQAPGRDYTEGNAWQYSLFVPHDVPGLVELLGGKRGLESYLDRLFTTPMTLKLAEDDDISGLIGQYAHGNEPSHHLAYLYALAGAPWKGQEVIRRILRTQYQDTPEGLSGNEDCGQMSAWYVMSALGFYSVTPGDPRYVIGTPLFDKVTLKLDGGRTFTIRARNNGPERPYIQKATLNGRPFDSCWLDHTTLVKGGELVFDMGEAPNKVWGLDTPLGEPARITPLPRLTNPVDTFLDRFRVEVAPTPGATVHYTLDGSEPTLASPRYTAPFDLTATTTLRLRAFQPGHAPSLGVTRELVRSEAKPAPEAQPGLRFEAYSGIYRSVYDYAQDRPVRSGLTAVPDLTVAPREDWFGLAFRGYVEVPADGAYTFFVTADDGGRLVVDGRECFESDGRKDKSLPQQGTVALKKGLHQFELGFYQCSHAKELKVEWQGPGLPRQAIPASAFRH